MIQITKDYSEQLEFLNSGPYYASKKLLTSRQISGTPYRLVPSQKSTEAYVPEHSRGAIARGSTKLFQ